MNQTHTTARPAATAASSQAPDTQEHAREIADTLRLLEQHVPIQRRLVRAGDTIYQASQPFASLYVLNSGFAKTVNLAADGREQVAALHFKGDWLGFDGVSDGVHRCDAIAMDTSQVWSVRYDTLLRACSEHPLLTRVLLAATSREMARDHEVRMSICTLPSEARVAEFLRSWSEALSLRGLRADLVALRMSRAEIGSYLGMTLESVSRALSQLAREQLIRFASKGRREIGIPNPDALAAFAGRSLAARAGALS